MLYASTGCVTYVTCKPALTMLHASPGYIACTGLGCGAHPSELLETGGEEVTGDRSHCCCVTKLLCPLVLLLLLLLLLHCRKPVGPYLAEPVQVLVQCRKCAMHLDDITDSARSAL